MMGGVNGSPSYVETMGLGYVTPGVNGGKATATVTQATKQVRLPSFLLRVSPPCHTITSVIMTGRYCICVLPRHSAGLLARWVDQ